MQEPHFRWWTVVPVTFGITIMSALAPSVLSLPVQITLFAGGLALFVGGLIAGFWEFIRKPKSPEAPTEQQEYERQKSHRRVQARLAADDAKSQLEN